MISKLISLSGIKLDINRKKAVLEITNELAENPTLQ
jgi:hypothetical protein